MTFAAAADSSLISFSISSGSLDNIGVYYYWIEYYAMIRMLPRIPPMMIRRVMSLEKEDSVVATIALMSPGSHLIPIDPGEHYQWY